MKKLMEYCENVYITYKYSADCKMLNGGFSFSLISFIWARLLSQRSAGFPYIDIPGTCMHNSYVGPNMVSQGHPPTRGRGPIARQVVSACVSWQVKSSEKTATQRKSKQSLMPDFIVHLFRVGVYEW